jgi:hypothetical protein
VDIIIIKDDFQTLANIIIANLTYRFGATCFDDDSAWNNS